MENVISTVQGLVAAYGLRVLGGIGILIIGWFAARVLRSTLNRVMAKARMDETLARFLSSAVYIGVMVFVVLAALNQVGVQTTSFIAVVGADPGATIGVLELGDSSINFAVRPWVKASERWPTRFDLLETIKTRFDAEGISIPYPQQDVHMHPAGLSAAA